MNAPLAHDLLDSPDAAADITAERLTADQVRALLDANNELKQVNARLCEAQDKLMQSEKLASIGQLADRKSVV